MTMPGEQAAEDPTADDVPAEGGPLYGEPEDPDPHYGQPGDDVGQDPAS